MSIPLKEVSDEEGKKNVKANFQRALDFGNREGLQDLLKEHTGKKKRVSMIFVEVLKDLLGIE